MFEVLAGAEDNLHSRPPGECIERHSHNGDAAGHAVRRQPAGYCVMCLDGCIGDSDRTSLGG